MKPPKIIASHYAMPDGNGGKEIKWRWVWSDIMKGIIIAMFVPAIIGGCNFFKSYVVAKSDICDLQKDVVDMKKNHEELRQTTGALMEKVAGIDGKLDIIIRNTR